MPVHVLMPALSPRMTEGRLARWLVAVDQRVEPGMVIAEIETPTATMEVEAVEAGVVREILVPAGRDGVAVGAPIAVLATDAELRRDGARASVTPARADAARRVAASPVARRRAAERGVQLETLAGSGPGGRIVLRDVEPAPVPLRLAEPRSRPAAAAASAAADPPQEAHAERLERRAGVAEPKPSLPAIYDAGASVVVAHTPARLAAARRLMAAQSTVPQLRLGVDCRLDDALKALRRLGGRSGGAKGAGRGADSASDLALEHLVVKAYALALQAVPEANATYAPEAALRHQSVHIAIELAREDGTVWPVLRDVERRSLAEIAGDLADLARRTASEALTADDVAGAAASLSILAAGTVRQVEGVLVPPAASLLMLGAPERRPVVGDGDRLEVATVVTATLVVDARLVDARAAGALLAAFRGYLEEPLRMLV